MFWNVVHQKWYENRIIIHSVVSAENNVNEILIILYKQKQIKSLEIDMKKKNNMPEYIWMLGKNRYEKQESKTKILYHFNSTLYWGGDVCIFCV